MERIGSILKSHSLDLHLVVDHLKEGVHDRCIRRQAYYVTSIWQVSRKDQLVAVSTVQ